MKGSGRFNLNEAEVRKILVNGLVFLAPAILAGVSALIVSVQAKITEPGAVGILAVVLTYGLNFLTDWLRKFVADNSKKTM